jgi:hypothetical protein
MVELMDWKAAVTIAGWVIPGIVGVIAGRALERRPKLLSYFQGSGAVTLQSTPPQTIHMHTVVVRNIGSRAANNLRITHTFLPAFSIFPPMQHHVDTLPSGERQIVIPLLQPKSQVTINYVYFPPLLWNQIHAGITSDEGSPRAVDMLVNPRPSRTVLITFFGLAALGLIAALYLLYEGYSILAR